MKTIRHTDCVEVGHDKFDEFVTNFLNKVGEPNIVSVTPMTYTHLDIGSQKLMTDYAVTIIDPRESFATEARFPGIDMTSEWPDEALERLQPDRGSAVIALTHDPKLDDPALAAALRSDCFYIGALGSRRNHAGRCGRLKEQGFTDSDVARIHGPVGLAIGAVSPAEVAISIVAEMTQILRRGEKAEAA